MDGNLHALNKHQAQEEIADLRFEAIEEKTLEVKEILLSVNHKFEKAFVIDSDGNKVELSDFHADMEIEDGVFSEFLQGNMYSDESSFRNKILSQLDVFCEQIATGLIDDVEKENDGY